MLDFLSHKLYSNILFSFSFYMESVTVIVGCLHSLKGQSGIYGETAAKSCTDPGSTVKGGARMGSSP